MSNSKLKVAKDMVVSFHYTLKDKDGKQLDSSVDQDPLPYLHGHGQIVPGLEKALTGKSCGDKAQVVVAAAEGYGEYNAEMVLSLPRNKFKNQKDLKVGNMFELEDGDGNAVLVRIKEVQKDEVVVDGNHPLAGVELHFDIEITAVREATKEELAHGHVHSHGCC